MAYPIGYIRTTHSCLSFSGNWWVIWKGCNSIIVWKGSDNLHPRRTGSLQHQPVQRTLSMVAKRVTNYLLENNYTDTSCKKESVSRFLGCVEYSAMTWEQIQAWEVWPSHSLAGCRKCLCHDYTLDCHMEMFWDRIRFPNRSTYDTPSCSNQYLSYGSDDNCQYWSASNPSLQHILFSPKTALAQGRHRWCCDRVPRNWLKSRNHAGWGLRKTTHQQHSGTECHSEG